MALYENGKRISGIRDFPAYTWDEYHALPAAKRPKVWKCTDRDYTDVLTADDIQYNGGTVEDALDDTVSKANGGTFNGNIVVDKQDGTTSAVGITELIVGNNKGSGVDKNSRGFLYLFSNAGKYCRLRNDNGTANRNIYLPDKDGTVAISSSAAGGLYVDSFTATSLTSGFVSVSKTGYKPVFAMVTNLPALVACRGILWDGATYYLRLEQWASNQTWTPYATPISCNIVAGYVPN